MAQDIRNLFKEESKVSNQVMPKGHEARFLEKLEAELPQQKHSRPMFRIISMAASIVVMLGLAIGAYTFYEGKETVTPDKTKEMASNLKSLGDISPDLKKVEDYYLANINLELSKVELNDDNKELFDSYVVRLEELNKEYQRLSVELTQSGPNELTVSALIDNLKLRLNLLYRLKEQLKDLNDSEFGQDNV
ncbi:MULTISPECIES: hypothetical protein [Mangrovimonas]|uniref:hypothetical protein n=1 Tax=Mangrovimonas TaxID=1211036 RepID=UPI0006B4DD28|nr:MULTISPECIES: hypothetical protein [Mangrovimonas]OMP31140.1 hypothetical protein BKM32_08735 [Mangrovimonas sp. DI 80]